MNRRRALLLASALLTIAFAGSVFQSDLVGWWRGEAKYKGRYANAWRMELRKYEFVRTFNFAHGVSGHWVLIFERKPAVWEKWLASALPSVYKLKTDSKPPLHEGDEEAFPVLIELLRAPEWNVRLLAMDGLRAIPGYTDEEITELHALLEDEHPIVVKTAKWALWDIARIAVEDTLPADDDQP